MLGACASQPVLPKIWLNPEQWDFSPQTALLLPVANNSGADVIMKIENRDTRYDLCVRRGSIYDMAFNEFVVRDADGKALHKALYETIVESDKSLEPYLQIPPEGELTIRIDLSELYSGWESTREYSVDWESTGIACRTSAATDWRLALSPTLRRKLAGHAGNIRWVPQK
jgi:hypothetical protein